jgi:hypothetical protein
LLQLLIELIVGLQVCVREFLHGRLEVALDEGCSWGYYEQGFGRDEKQDKMDWTARPREDRWRFD